MLTSARAEPQTAERLRFSAAVLASQALSWPCRPRRSATSPAAPPDTSASLAKYTALEERVNTLARNLELAETRRSLEYVAAFTATDTGYSTIRFDVGMLAVSFADIQPFANGSRVKLTFGNPTSARIQGLKLSLEWGGSTDIKTREHVLTEVLLPGSWVTVSIPLDGVTPAQFSGLRVRYLGHQGVFLNGRKDP